MTTTTNPPELRRPFIVSPLQPTPFKYASAKRDLNRWFEAEWQKLLAEKAHREREIERKFWNGDYSR